MSLVKELLKATLGQTVEGTHEAQKNLERDLSFTDKLKLRLAKKGNWITFISLGFAIAEQNPLEIVENAQVIFQWFF